MSRILAQGSLRVDARRAVAELREHLLVDLHQYLLELVRAAAAGGATRIDLTCDADDLSLTFDGAPIPESALGRLLDHVLEDAATPEARRLRLFALGVNAALGLLPASVEVFRRDEEACCRVCWSGGRGAAEAVISASAPERVPAPEGMPPGTTRVAVRRRFSWDVLKKAIVGGAPREVELLRGAAFGLSATLTQAGKPFPLAPRAPALVRALFDLPGVRRAALEILPARAASPSIELLEHGVCLIRARLDFGLSFPSQPLGDIELPARVIVDADALPTNASRGKLREDAALGRLIQERALGAFHDAVLALCAVVAGEGEVPAGVEVVAKSDKVALEDALGAVLCVVGEAIHRGAVLPDGIRALLELPLLRDGHGDPLAFTALRAGRERPIYLWKRPEPIPRELTPWMSDTVWIRGRIAERLLTGLHVADAEALVERALRSVERRRQLLERAPSEPVLAEPAAALTRTAFHARGGPWDGLQGEVAILAGSPPTRRIHVFVEDRLLETVELDAAVIPLPIEAAIGWEGRLRPRFGYDGVEQDEAFRLAVSYAVVVAAREAGDRLVREGPALHPVLRAAIGAIVVTPSRLGVSQAPPGTFEALRAARIWETTEPGRLESMNSLAAVATRAKGLCTADAGASGKATDGRPVLVLSPREAGWLKAAFVCPLVPYGDALLAGPGADEAHKQRSARVLEAALRAELTARRGPVFDLVQAAIRAKITLGAAPRVTFCHAGKILCSSELPAGLGPVEIAVDDDNIVPTPGWDGLLTPLGPELLGAIERTFCERVVGAMEGDPRAQAELQGAALTNNSAVRDYLIDRFTALTVAEPGQAEDKQLAARIGMLPIFTVLDERGAPTAASLSALAAMHPPPQPIPILAEPPGFETLTWHPVIATSPALVVSLQRWSGGRAFRAESSLPGRLVVAFADRELRAFLSGPEQDPRALGDLADPGAISVFLDSEGPDGISVAVALPRASMPEPTPGLACPWIDALFRGRALCRRPLPALPIQVVARVGLFSDNHILGLRDLSPAGLDRVADRLQAASGLLACAIVNAASAPGAGAVFFRDARALRLVLELLRSKNARLTVGVQLGLDELAAMLVHKALLWPTVQGEPRAFEELETDEGKLLMGRQELVPWHPPLPSSRSDLDRPILLLRSGPEGELLQGILAALGREVSDVSDALRRLQARRSRSAPDEVPLLPGAPVHPALRVRLDALGVHAAEGEIEILAGPASDVRFLDDLAPAPRPIAATLPFPMRILARVDRADPTHESARAILRKIAAAGGRHLLSLAPRLDELPGFVRDHLRGAVCKAVASGRRVGKRAATARLFPDITGAVHTYDHLTHDPTADLAATTDPPPYPRRVYRVPVLCLTEVELGQIKAAFRLRDVTALLRRDLAAERRANAPPAPAIALAPEARPWCLAVVPLPEGPVTGEVGILAPEHVTARGITVFCGRRPVCMILDGIGWPVVAVVNDDTAVVNRFFDDINVDGADRIRTAVRAAAGAALRELLAPPPDALAVRWFDGSELANAGVTLAGSIYLSAIWPREPSVKVRLPGSAASVPRSLVVSEAPPYLFGDIPVGGQLLSSADGPWHAAATLALRAAAEMVHALEEAGREAPALPLYQWDLRLLGHAAGGALLAPTGDGGGRGPAEVLAELALRGGLWVSTGDGDGSIDGAFPASGEALPSFVLKDGSPLVAVLRHRAAPGVLRELAKPPAEAAPVAIEAPPPEPAWPVEIQERPADPLAPKPWGGEIWQALRSFFRPEEPLPIETPLCASLHEAISELELEGWPVREVVEVGSGPPLRFEEARGRLSVNAQHRALSWLGAADRRALVFLVAAAVSEINRAVLAVTDEEERRVLGVLLARAAGDEG